MKRYPRYQIKRRVYSDRRSERHGQKRLIITLLLGGAVAYLFFTWFLPTLISSLGFLNNLKENESKIENISEGDIIAPPVLSIPFEATNSSTITIHGYSSPSLEVNLYLDDNLVRTVSVNEDGSFNSEIKLVLGVNNISAKTIKGSEQSLPSKTVRVIFDDEKPNLEVQEPEDNKVVQGGDKKVNITGKTDPSDTSWLEAGGMRIIFDSLGNFSYPMNINDGDNNIEIVAKDAAGNVNKITRKVIYQP